jgi:signal transduction histidine kinase
MRAADKVNILIVDDDERKLFTYEAILAELGENLILTRSADEALAILPKHDIGLVLLDVSMPGIDGFRLAEMIREHPRYMETPIIFISAINVTDPDRLIGYRRGAVDYISAPINPELLRARVSVFARLHRSAKRLERMNSDLTQLSNRLLEVQDNERRRIARELHDSLGQELTCAKMIVAIAARSEDTGELRKRLDDVSAAIDRALHQTRNISYLLHPPMLDECGLGTALKLYLEGLEKRSRMKTSIEIDPSNFPRLKPETETALFRIVQECLTNVIRHSEGTRAWVSLVSRDGQLLATVRDDGKGLANRRGAFLPGEIGVGVWGMRQRVRELGGEFRIQNANPGVLVEVTVPVPYTSKSDTSESLA